MNYPNKEDAIEFAKSFLKSGGYRLNYKEVLYNDENYYDIECKELMFIEPKRQKSILDMGDLVISFIFFDNGQCLFKKLNTKVELDITDCWRGFNKNINNYEEVISGI